MHVLSSIQVSTMNGASESKWFGVLRAQFEEGGSW
jgi:hypothetical protein